MLHHDQKKRTVQIHLEGYSWAYAWVICYSMPCRRLDSIFGVSVMVSRISTSEAIC